MSGSKRVFALELDEIISVDLHQHLKQSWETETKGTELEGSKIIILEGGVKIRELTGDGLPKLQITEDGKLVFCDEESDS